MQQRKNTTTKPLNQNKMKKEFVPRYLSIKLKDIGYNQKVFAWSDIYNDFIFYMYPTNENNMNQYEDVISIPTFSQAFRWFREKYDLFHSIDTRVSKDIGYLILLNDEEIHIDSCYWNYEEAESACLDKLIEIVEIK
jgi:hypothetical protein